MYIELFISKPTQKNSAILLQANHPPHQQELMHTQIHINKYFEHVNQTTVSMVVIEFCRRQEQEPYISRTFIWLILLDYKRAEQSRSNSVSLVLR